MTYPTRRDVMEKSCHAALARYKQAVAEGTWRVTADNALVDAILKAADRYALTEEERRELERRLARLPQMVGSRG